MGQTMVLLGYHLTSIYKPYNLKDIKVVINKDVKYDERKWWSCKLGIKGIIYINKDRTKHIIVVVLEEEQLDIEVKRL